jgi:hypothetical protein
MAEVVLRGTIGILPRVEGGRHVVISEDNGDIYRIPLPPKLHKEVTEALGRSEEELAAQAERQHAADKIVLPGEGAAAGAGTGTNGHGGPGTS